MEQGNLSFGEGYSGEGKEEKRDRLVKSIQSKLVEQSRTQKPADFSEEERDFIKAEREDLSGDGQPQYKH